jgi:hypothetical protein
MKGSPAKLLAKLNSKPAQFDRAPSGIDGITSLDVAHVLGLNKNAIQTMLVRVKWAHDAAAIPLLVDAVTARVEAKAMRQKWFMRKPDTIKRMVVLALREREVIRPRRNLTIIDSPYEAGAEKCRGCCGVGRRYSTRQVKIITCERCEGSGDRHWSDAERAGHCGLRPQSWSADWERRYMDVVEMLKAMEGRAMRVIKAYMADTHAEFLELKRELDR